MKYLCKCTRKCTYLCIRIYNKFGGFIHHVTVILLCRRTNSNSSHPYRKSLQNSLFDLLCFSLKKPFHTICLVKICQKSERSDDIPLLMDNKTTCVHSCACERQNPHIYLFLTFAHRFIYFYSFKEEKSKYSTYTQNDELRCQ